MYQIISPANETLQSMYDEWSHTAAAYMQVILVKSDHLSNTYLSWQCHCLEKKEIKNIQPGVYTKNSIFLLKELIGTQHDVCLPQTGCHLGYLSVTKGAYRITTNHLVVFEANSIINAWCYFKYPLSMHSAPFERYRSGRHESAPFPLPIILVTHWMVNHDILFTRWNWPCLTKKKVIAGLYLKLLPALL